MSTRIGSRRRLWGAAPAMIAGSAVAAAAVAATLSSARVETSVPDGLTFPAHVTAATLDHSAGTVGRGFALPADWPAGATSAAGQAGPSGTTGYRPSPFSGSAASSTASPAVPSQGGTASPASATVGHGGSTTPVRSPSPSGVVPDPASVVPLMPVISIPVTPAPVSSGPVATTVPVTTGPIATSVPVRSSPTVVHSHVLPVPAAGKVSSKADSPSSGLPIGSLVHSRPPAPAIQAPGDQKGR